MTHSIPHYHRLMQLLFLGFCLLTTSLCFSATPPSPTEKYIQISALDQLVCAIKQDQTVSCWGDEYYLKDTPVEERFVQINQSLGAICGITLQGTLHCWGLRPKSSPESTPDGSFIFIGQGALFHNCAIKTDNQLVCWTWGDDDPYGVTKPPEGTFIQVASGAKHSCAIRDDGVIQCWGANNEGQIDAPEGQFSAIAAGSSHNCAIKTDGSVHCWGYNQYGLTKSPFGSFKEITSSGTHNCAVTPKGMTTCWSQNSSKLIPKRKFVHVSAGMSYTCGIDDQGRILCWGDEKAINELTIPEPVLAGGQATDPIDMTYPNKPSDRTMTVDAAGLLTPGNKYHIDEVALKLWHVKGISIYVVTLDRLSRYFPAVRDKATDQQLQDYAQGLMKNWDIGADKNPRDMLLLVARDDKKLRIQLGNGWSHAYDPHLDAIIQLSIIPYLKQGRFGDGILAGVNELNLLARNPQRVQTASVDTLVEQTNAYLGDFVLLLESFASATETHKDDCDAMATAIMGVIEDQKSLITKIQSYRVKDIEPALKKLEGKYKDRIQTLNGKIYYTAKQQCARHKGVSNTMKAMNKAMTPMK